MTVGPAAAKRIAVPPCCNDSWISWAMISSTSSSSDLSRAEVDADAIANCHVATDVALDQYGKQLLQEIFIDQLSLAFP